MHIGELLLLLGEPVEESTFLREQRVIRPLLDDLAPLDDGDG